MPGKVSPRPIWSFGDNIALAKEASLVSVQDIIPWSLSPSVCLCLVCRSVFLSLSPSPPPPLSVPVYPLSSASVITWSLTVSLWLSLCLSVCLCLSLFHQFLEPNFYHENVTIWSLFVCVTLCQYVCLSFSSVP